MISSFSFSSTRRRILLPLLMLLLLVIIQSSSTTTRTTGSSGSFGFGFGVGVVFVHAFGGQSIRDRRGSNPGLISSFTIDTFANLDVGTVGSGSDSDATAITATTSPSSDSSFVVDDPMFLPGNDDNSTLSTTTPSTPVCTLCQGDILLSDINPIYEPIDNVLPANLTCDDFDVFARTTFDSQAACIESGIRQGLTWQCCESVDIPVYQCETNIRQSRGLNSTRYDYGVPPITSRSRPLDVNVQIIYQTVEDLNVQAGTMTIFLTISMGFI
jgi:hypothetical protein